MQMTNNPSLFAKFLIFSKFCTNFLCTFNYSNTNEPNWLSSCLQLGAHRAVIFFVFPFNLMFQELKISLIILCHSTVEMLLFLRAIHILPVPMQKSNIFMPLPCCTLYIFWTSSPMHT